MYNPSLFFIVPCSSHSFKLKSIVGDHTSSLRTTWSPGGIAYIV